MFKIVLQSRQNGIHPDIPTGRRDCLTGDMRPLIGDPPHFSLIPGRSADENGHAQRWVAAEQARLRFKGLPARSGEDGVFFGLVVTPQGALAYAAVASSGEGWGGDHFLCRAGERHGFVRVEKRTSKLAPKMTLAVTAHQTILNRFFTVSRRFVAMAALPPPSIDAAARPSCSMFRVLLLALLATFATPFSSMLGARRAFHTALTMARKAGVAEPAELRSFVQAAGDRLVVVDVRNPDAEVEPGDQKSLAVAPLPGDGVRPAALHLIWDRSTDSMPVPEVSKDTPIITHCGGGGRGQLAKDYLESQGFTAVLNGGGPKETDCWAEFGDK